MPADPTFGLAHRKVLGRRPEVVRWTPSKGLPWWFGSWSDDRRFTAEQERALIAMGRDPVTHEAMTVRHEATDEHVWTPMRQWRPIYEFEAPLLARRADDKVTIIAPDGSRKNIRADGWGLKPSSRPVGDGW